MIKKRKTNLHFKKAIIRSVSNVSLHARAYALHLPLTVDLHACKTTIKTTRQSRIIVHRVIRNDLTASLGRFMHATLFDRAVTLRFRYPPDTMITLTVR